MSAQLTVLVYGATAMFWLAALISIRAALAKRRPPRALTEGTIEKILAAAFVTVYAVIFWNTDHANALFSVETARVLARLAPILFVAKPLLFIATYLVNGFRDDDYAEAGRRLSR